MTQIAPIELDDGTIIYIEVTENVSAPIGSNQQIAEEAGRVSKGGSLEDAQGRIIQSFQAIEGTIKAYTYYSLSAFRELTIANVNKVTLEFGIKVGGEVGIPYVTKGTAESNLKITVECSFLK